MRIGRTAQTASRRRRDHGQGSPGSKMKTIVNAREKRFPGKTALDKAAG